MNIFKLLATCLGLIIVSSILAIPASILSYYISHLGIRLGRWIRNRNRPGNNPQSLLEMIELTRRDESIRRFYLVEEYKAPLLIYSEFYDKDIIALQHTDATVTSITKRDNDKWVFDEVWRSKKSYERATNIALYNMSNTL